MTLVFIDQDKLSVSKTNMRHAKKAPDVSDILPAVRKRGVIQTLLVRPNCQDGHFEIVAGARRFHAARRLNDEIKTVGIRELVGLLPRRRVSDLDMIQCHQGASSKGLARIINNTIILMVLPMDPAG
jgi:ParB family chromosome partitioning protein